MNLITKYYQGIYTQIQAELEFINELFIHNGLKGEGNEAILTELIKKFIPKKYGVGSGIVIDKEGTPSRQCDIVIFDKHNYPQFLTLSNLHFFPVDLVYAVIEIKTTLDGKQAKLSKENIKSVRSLKYIKDTFRVNVSEPMDLEKDNSLIWQNKATTPPIGLVFSYQSSTNNFITLNNWFQYKTQEEKECLPSHIFSLDHGFIITKLQDKVKPILCPLVIDGEVFHKRDSNNFNKKKNKIWAEKFGIYYPISKLKNEEFLVDQSKIFLNFMMILTQLLNRKEISPNIDFRKEYLSEEMKTFLSIEDNKITSIINI